MKASIFASFVLGIIAVGAMPSADVETFVDDDGNTYVGADKASLALRGLEARCNCAVGGTCVLPGGNCVPGRCQCMGDYGCWSCKGGRMQCQPDPRDGKSCWT
ncbi:Uncharacterized protein TPAR_00530 [Tolypocladium paradoxum]|uniref:EGF-like domain-containing protein n=1 Tax=Tolypocladium paradoxum TaxID=94208 RepID=A0A2S4LA40_9HYPO|nr:Uncharacterized protein TPAR_00530 [Tolypocladium paradoxum]